MFRPCFLLLAVTVLLAVPAMAQEKAARLTAGLPAYVGHDKDRPGPQDWNEGWLNNEGLFIDLSWPVHVLGENTDLRAGFTGGAFDNSLGEASFFLGGMAEIESHVSDRFALSIGSYAGGITGYDRSPAPAVAPYLGASYAVNEKLELGLRGFWLPAETIAGADLAPSDAYVLAATVGTRF